MLPTSPKVAKSLNMGLLAASVSPSLRLLARNVSRKHPLFASPCATVCKPLQLGLRRLGRRRMAVGLPA